MYFLNYLVKNKYFKQNLYIVRREKYKILQYCLFLYFTHQGIQLKWEENKYQIKGVSVGCMHLERQRKKWNHTDPWISFTLYEEE